MMPVRGVLARPPVVLIVDDQEWSTRSLESVLAPDGYAVMRAYTAAAALERARAQPPDLVFVSNNLPDSEGIGLCAALVDDAVLSPATPVIMTSPDPPTRERRLTALHAGAWDFISYPIDAQELLLRLGAFVRAKFEADRARELCLLDESTGLYNFRGLEQRAQEIRSQAYRERTALACIVIAPVLPDDADSDTVPQGAGIAGAIEQLGRALRQSGRISDAIGRLGQSEFAIVAPRTDSGAATQLAERLAHAIAVEHGKPLELRAGYDAVPNVREQPVEARNLMAHAAMALRRAKADGDKGWIHEYEGNR
ncbi:MAG: response regulator [Gemmatimonadota bacterium]|nr:MAG: response regulator [Gemmatimonadota bacterium]